MEPRVREPTIVVRGDVPDPMVVYAHEKLFVVVAHASVPVLDVELRLDHHAGVGPTSPHRGSATSGLPRC